MYPNQGPDPQHSHQDGFDQTRPPAENPYDRPRYGYAPDWQDDPNRQRTEQGPQSGYGQWSQQPEGNAGYGEAGPSPRRAADGDVDRRFDAQPYSNQQFGGPQHADHQFGGQYGDQQFGAQQYAGQEQDQAYGLQHQQFGGQRYGDQRYAGQQFGAPQHNGQHFGGPRHDPLQVGGAQHDPQQFGGPQHDPRQFDRQPYPGQQFGGDQYAAGWGGAPQEGQGFARLAIRQKITLSANRYVISALDENGQEGQQLAFAQQKRLAFKEEVTFFTDESRSTPVFSFKARQMLDLAATYDVFDANQQPIGWFRRDFGKSFLRSTWHLGDTRGLETTGTERSQFIAILRRLMDDSWWLNNWYHFDFFTPEGEPVLHHSRAQTLRECYALDLPAFRGGQRLDWRLAAAMGVALDTLQER